MAVIAPPLPASIPSSRAGVWLLACRPKTLAAGVAPVVVGAAVAWHEGAFRPWVALTAGLGALLLQIGANLTNDVCDFQKGADTSERLGPVRVVQAGLLSPREVFWGVVASFVGALCTGVVLTWLSGPWVVGVGLCAILFAVLYTAGPWPLAYLGLGELFVFSFFGFAAVLGTAFAQTETISQTAILLSVVVGALASAILVVNNLRDHLEDRMAHKRTLVVRFGLRFGRMEYVAMLGLAYGVTAYVAYSLRTPFLCLPFLTLPEALRLVRDLHQTSGSALNRLLARTARLELVFSLLIGAGVLLG